jgi:drug/metabolite transporter (DMT)-like permease
VTADILPWLWIPVTIWAAFAQTLRNAAQRHLTTELGTLGATLVRFLYGLPFAILWLLALIGGAGLPLPSPNWAFLFWVATGALTQILAQALLLKVMSERNFLLGVAYAKTEILQVAVFSFVLLSDPITIHAALAILAGTCGVFLLSPADKERPIRALLTGWTSRTAVYGLASGACLALSAVGYRGAALALESPSFLAAAGYTLVWAQTLQTVGLGGWLLWRQRQTVMGVLRAWRRSLFAGFMGAAASAGWFTAMAIEPAAHVRTLGLIELLFSYAISRRFFRERTTGLEIAGIALLTLGVVIVSLR